MTDQLCFVQFIHPAGEHEPDGPGLKLWNRGPHRRKFLRSLGRLAGTDGASQDDELILWGEWEPESRVVATFKRQVPEGPRFLYEPFHSNPTPSGWRQNTDPFVVGDRFHTFSFRATVRTSRSHARNALRTWSRVPGCSTSPVIRSNRCGWRMRSASLSRLRRYDVD